LIPLAARSSSYVFGIAHTVSGSPSSEEDDVAGSVAVFLVVTVGSELG
jgi:hypothetical protein